LRETLPDHAALEAEFAPALRWLAQQYDAAGQAKEALATYREALSIERALVQLEPKNVQMTEELVGTLTSLCDLGREWDGADAAEASCVEARTIAQGLSKARPRDGQVAYLLARALKGSGMQALAAHRESGARELFEGAVDAGRRAVERSPNDMWWKSELADCLKGLGRAELALARPDAARARFREAMAIVEPRLGSESDAWDLDFVGELWGLIGDTERGDAARDDFARAVARCEEAHAADPDSVDSMVDLSRVRRRLASFERDPKRRADLLKSADDVVAPLVAEGRLSPEWRALLASASK
jgi:tetratricopeptide (TPR) repeat protein